jgi:hypothetical protein
MRIFIDSIVIPSGRRKLDPNSVKELAKSIKEIGLKTPITIRKVRKVVDGERESHWELVAGRHRLAAVKKNGDTKIDCVEESGSADDATLWEIAENLHRKELATQERADDIAKWVGLIAARVSAAPAAHTPKVSKRGRVGEGKKPGAVSEVAEKLGMSKNAVKESVTISKLSDAVREAADDAGLTGHKERLAIARVPPSEQLAKVAALKAGEAISINPIAAAWDRASRKQRLDFVANYSEEFDKYEPDFG